MLIVEVGFKLDENFEYYDKMLKLKGFVDDENVVTRDIYYSNKILDGLSENEMKNACIRLRSCNNHDFIVQNNTELELNTNLVEKDSLNKFENRINDMGYKKVFDTFKKDHLSSKEGMNSIIQLQEIENIGLMLYYDNSSYYGLDLDEQRKRLIDELNRYGFRFTYDMLGIDKLRTLYYKQPMFSKNQNA